MVHQYAASVVERFNKTRNFLNKEISCFALDERRSWISCSKHIDSDRFFRTFFYCEERPFGTMPADLQWRSKSSKERKKAQCNAAEQMFGVKSMNSCITVRVIVIQSGAMCWHCKRGSSTSRRYWSSSFRMGAKWTWPIDPSYTSQQQLTAFAEVKKDLWMTQTQLASGQLFSFTHPIIPINVTTAKNTVDVLQA